MPLYPGASNVVPAASSADNATKGTLGTFARGDHAHPRYSVDATDCNFLAWNYDVAMAQGSYILGTSGTLVVIKIQIPIAMTITNVNLWLSVVGSGLTAGQSFVALYDNDKDKLAQSADQATNFAGSTGLKTISLGSSPAVSPGNCYVVVWSNGTTLPSFRSIFSATVGSANAGLAAADSRWATANTSVTTSGPGTLGGFTALSGTPWAALS